jgi:hypothetical protein
MLVMGNYIVWLVRKIRNNWGCSLRDHHFNWDPLKNVINSFLKFFASTQATPPPPMRLIVRNGRPN